MSVDAAVALPATTYTRLHEWKTGPDRRTPVVLAVGDGAHVVKHVAERDSATIPDEAMQVWMKGLTTVVPTQAKHGQILTAAIDPDRIVWQQSTSTDLMRQPWTMWSYDRATKDVTLVTRSPKLDDGTDTIAPPGWTAPVLSGDWVYWAQSGGSTSRLGTDIWRCRVTDCDPIKVLEGGAFPTTSGNAVYAVEWPYWSFGSAAKDARVVRYDRAAEDWSEVATIPISEERHESPVGLAASEEVVAWIVTAVDTSAGDTEASVSRSTLSIKSLTSGSISTIDGDQFSSPSAGEGFVAWALPGSGERSIGGWIYDLKSAQVYSVGNTLGLYNVLASGRTLVWQESAPGAAESLPRNVVVEMN